MGSTRRSYTPEYKAQSVAFVIEGGRPVAEVARNIGVHEMTLGKWVKVARDAAESGKNPDAPLGESERAELVRLRAESRDDKSAIAELRMQVEFAKKVSDLVRERQSSKIRCYRPGWELTSAPTRCHSCVPGWEVSRSGYYAWRAAEPSQRSRDDSWLIAVMKKVYGEARGNPGCAGCAQAWPPWVTWSAQARSQADASRWPAGRHRRRGSGPPSAGISQSRPRTDLRLHRTACGYPLVR